MQATHTRVAMEDRTIFREVPPSHYHHKPHSQAEDTRGVTRAMAAIRDFKQEMRRFRNV